MEISVKNPCIRKCDYNDQKICVSCFRTQQEIYFWGDFDDKQKSEIIMKREERKTEIEKLNKKRD